MTIVPLIQRIVKNRFGTYFNGIESFYLKNFLLGMCVGFPSRPFESDSDKYRYATFKRDDHPILFPPMVHRIIL